MQTDTEYRFDDEVRAPTVFSISSSSAGEEPERKLKVIKTPIRRTVTQHSHVRKYSTLTSDTAESSSPDSPRRYYVKSQMTSLKQHPYLKQTSIRSTASGSSNSPSVSIAATTR